MIWTWDYANPQWVHLIWVAIAMIVVLGVLELRARDALASFLTPRMQHRLATSPSRGRVIARLVLLWVALLAGVLAIMRPQSKREPVAMGSAQVTADVAVVLDVSKSMLAEDAPPNRLARAKVEIEEMVKQLGGYRIGLVAFAGRAVLLSPLTSDHSFFNLVLRGVDVRSVSRGGTRIGDAIRTAVRAFPVAQGAKLIVLITDGEDHESFPLDAAKEAAAAGIHIVAVGIGSEEGSPILITDPTTGAKQPLLHDGQPVQSRLDGETLRQIAVTTEGAYVPAGTLAIDLKAIVEQHVKPIVREATDEVARFVPGERYVWFVLLSLVALIGAVAVGASTGERRGR